MKHIGEAIKKAMSNRKRVAWITIISVALLLLVFGGIQAYRILYNPQALFNVSTMSPTVLATQNATPAPTPAPEVTDAPIATDAATPSPTVAPTSTANTDITTKSDIVNILLIGVDRSETVGKLSGNDPHSDVMIVVAINFKENKVDLISLRRDTFVHAPELMDGVYKLNASLNLGGGYAAKDGAGFLKVCEAAKYMLGGIPVDYYYAVDFTSLMSIVDTIGGVDYTVENRAYSLKGISGKQHMNGADVLFYMRTRKVGPDRGDVNRVIRQKKMLIAMFKQLSKNGKLSMLPGLISTVKGGIYTNTTLDQTLALVNFAQTLDASKISTHSIGGEMADKASWHYCFTDQAARQKLIKQIYGVDVPQQVHCSKRYADWVVNYGFSGIRYLETAKQLLDYADAHQADFTAGQLKAYNTLTASYAQTQKAYDSASLSFSSKDNSTLANDKKNLKANTTDLAKLLGYKGALKWTYNHSYWLDPGINKMRVDFR